MVEATLDGMAGRRHVRRRRRRLPPLLGGRPLARPALREDALRQRRARLDLPARLGRHREERYREVVEERSTTSSGRCAFPGAGLASAQDADTDGVEGLTYTWTEEEAHAVGLPRELLEPFEHGRLIVRGELDAELRGRVLEERSTRPQPFRDDKALASWNGLALAALAEAGYRLERDDWVAAPATSPSSCSGRSRTRTGASSARARRAGERSASSTTTRTSRTACSSCTSRTARLRWLLEAHRLALLAIDLFADDERGGFYLTGGRRRARPTHEGSPGHAGPSGNSMLAWVLLRLARIWGDDELERRAVSVFRLVEPALRRAPGAFAWMLCGLDLWLSPPREIAIVGPVALRSLRPALAPFQPRAVVAVGPSDEVPLLEGKGLVDGKPAVYVCERFVCQAPVTDPEALGCDCA